MSKKLVFLYTELAPYIIRCMEAISVEGVDVHVIAYPVNKEAPFQFIDASGDVHFYNRTEFGGDQIEELLKKIDPDVIVCSGWIDKGYIKAVKAHKDGAKKVIALDNQIETGFKSRVSRLRAKTFYARLFDCCWVPGPPQAAFARSIGFRKNQIKQKFYTADYDHFQALDKNSERAEFPKRFVFVGRYLPFKGIYELFKGFAQLDQSDWQLYAAGAGNQVDDTISHPKIHHLGFVQPGDLDNFVRQGGVFILPSWKEPWGVVIHEFASAGYPILCSDKVGAASVFLKNGQNGFSFLPKDTESLKSALKKVISLPDPELFKMGNISKSLASKYTIQDWVTIANEILNHE